MKWRIICTSVVVPPVKSSATDEAYIKSVQDGFQATCRRAQVQMLGHLPAPFVSLDSVLRHIIMRDETVWHSREQTVEYEMKTCTDQCQSKESSVFKLQ